MTSDVPHADPRLSCTPGEETPAAVERVRDYLHAHGVWHRFSRNREARSCRDAAHKRNRLGHEGIPLHDELKSWLGQYSDREARTHRFLAHCRADRLLDLELVGRALGAHSMPERLRVETLEPLGVRYGLVNPFQLAAPGYGTDGSLLTAPIAQVFDREVVESVLLPGTMMTNAGDLTWAVEFEPHTLIAALPHARLAEITAVDPNAARRPRVTRSRNGIAILTGNAPESGMRLWKVLNDNVRAMLGAACFGDISMPPVTVLSLPILGLTMELQDRHAAVWKELEVAIDRAAHSNVGALAVACNTTHYFSSRIRERCSRHGIEFIAMPAVVRRWLRERDIREVALVGIGPVATLGPWSGFRDDLAEIRVEQPSAKGLERIQQIAYQVKVEGVSEAALNRLRDVLRQEVQSQHVVIALTELSLLVGWQRKKPRSDRVIIDTLGLLGEALANWFLRPPL